MVTVASDVTVPSALRLIPISPLLTVSGTIDIGAAAPRPPPAPLCCGAVPCLVHQTTPAMTSKTSREGSRKPRRGRGLTFGGGPRGGALVGGFRGWSMNLPSEQRGVRLLRHGVSLPVLRPLGHSQPRYFGRLPTALSR